MSGKFHNKVIAITGAASGMGLAIATLLASQGAIISLADLNENAMKAAVSHFDNSSRHIYTVVDVRDSKSVNSWIERTIKDLGKLDGCVNMAGIITKAAPIKDMEEEDLQFSLDVNTKGVFNCLRAQLRAMGMGGSIVSRVHTIATINSSDILQ